MAFDVVVGHAPRNESRRKRNTYTYTTTSCSNIFTIRAVLETFLFTVCYHTCPYVYGRKCVQRS